MKKTMKTTVKLLALGSLLISPLASHAAVVKDINSAMSMLLGHDASITNINDQRVMSLTQGSPAFQPWSSSYWPDILGGIGDHAQLHGTKYSEVQFALKFFGFAKNRWSKDFKNTCEKYDNWSPDDLNKNLSAAEKYDLLVGNTDFSFSNAIQQDIDFRSNYRKTSVMNDGSAVDNIDNYDGDDNTELFADVPSTYSSFDQKLAFKYWKKKGGSLAYWFGICDGWSPAAVSLPRPVNPVTVTGATGKLITFYPDDLKALGDYLFARTNNDYMTTMNYHFAGRPCGSGDKPDLIEDGKPHAGRVKDFRCNDVDAGVWHLTLLNRIGLDKMGFVFEIDNNRKINNHPVASYSLKYFNPATGKEGSLADSTVAIGSVKDAYADRRNPKAVALVGVKSAFNYMNYQWPEDHHDAKWHYDSPAQDEVKNKEYAYDLELDAAGNILGGEWGDRSKEKVDKAQYADQPDFIWMAAPQNLPHSEMSTDTTMGDTINPANPRLFGNMKWAWDGKSALPSDWLAAAKKDQIWQAPVVGVASDVPNSSLKNVSPEEAKNSILKSAQPLSNIVYFLFDQARDPRENY